MAQDKPHCNRRIWDKKTKRRPHTPSSTRMSVMRCDIRRSIMRLMVRSEKAGAQNATPQSVILGSAAHKRSAWRRNPNRQVFRQRLRSWPRESRLALREEW